MKLERKISHLTSLERLHANHDSLRIPFCSTGALEIYIMHVHNAYVPYITTYFVNSCYVVGMHI